jgi:hypothetical protein
VITGARWDAVAWREEGTKRREGKLRREQTISVNTRATRVILTTRPILQTWRIRTTCYRMRRRI